MIQNIYLGICEMRWNECDFISGDYLVIYRVIYSGWDNGLNRVDITVNKIWDQYLRSYLIYNDRMIMVKLKSVPNDIVIIQIYTTITKLLIMK